jgi:hypothetical protein
MKTLSGIYLSNRYQTSRREIGVIAPGGAYNNLMRVFSDRKIAKDRIPRLISIDQALLSYLERQKNKSVIKELPYFSIREIYQKTVNILEKNYLQSIPNEKLFLFNFVDGKLVVNKEVRNIYRSVLPTTDVTHTNNALIIAQPLAQVGMASKNEERTALLKVIKKLQQSGFNIMIRPHPREELEKYSDFNTIDVSIKNNETAIETEIRSLRPEICVGVYSTALLTSKVLFNIPTYTYVEEFRQDNDELPGNLDFFRKITDNLLSDFDELEEKR